MYCPRCSHEQVAEETRFCSRCGFPLTIVSQLVANDGVFAVPEMKGEGRLSPRQRGLRQGGILLSSSMLMAAFAAIMTGIKPILLFWVTLLSVIGVARVLYAFLFEQGKHMETEVSPGGAIELQQLPASRSSLPSHQHIPVTDWGRPLNTSEISQPSSVTDRTTKLFDHEAGEDRMGKPYA